MAYRSPSPLDGRDNARGFTTAQVDGKTLKGGNLFISDISFPESPTAGFRFTVGVTVSNGAGFINSADPDSCSRGIFENGYNYEVAVLPGWGDTKTESGCIGTTELGTADVDHEFTFTAPEAVQAYSLAIRLRVPNSGNQFDVPRTIQPSCTSDSNCPGDLRCQSGGECGRPPGSGNGDDGNGGSDGGNGGGQPGGVGSACTADVGCAGDLVCQDGICAEPSGGPFAFWSDLSSDEKLLVGGATALIGGSLLFGGEQARQRR